MIRLEVEEHRHPRSQRLDVLELERRQLAHDPRVRGRHADQRRQRAADVPRDLDGHRGRLEDRTEQRRGRGLPVGAGDPDERVREQPRAELDLGDHGDAASAGGRDRLAVARHARALDHEPDAVEQLLCERAEVHLRVETERVQSGVAVVCDDVGVGSVRPQRFDRGPARPREAQDEDALWHGHGQSWKRR